MFIPVIICIAVGYGFGCISTGYLTGRLFHVDIQHHGSGNIGTTNALRTMGLKGGIITFLGDVGKTVAAVLLTGWLLNDPGMDPKLVQLCTGMGVIIGHNYPFWLHFKGGKGIAATAGLLVIFDWRIAVMAAVGFLIPVAATRYVSVGSLVVSFALPLGIGIFYRDNPDFIPMMAVAVFLFLLAVFRHRSNLVRLANGTENKLGDRAKD